MADPGVRVWREGPPGLQHRCFLQQARGIREATWMRRELGSTELGRGWHLPRPRTLGHSMAGQDVERRDYSRLYRTSHGHGFVAVLLLGKTVRENARIKQKRLQVDTK